MEQDAFLPEPPTPLGVVVRAAACATVAVAGVWFGRWISGSEPHDGAVYLRIWFVDLALFAIPFGLLRWLRVKARRR